MTTDDTALRLKLIETCQALIPLGLTRGTAGNVSVRSGDGLLISPTGIPYDKLTPELVVHLRIDGSCDGTVLPSSEWRFHRDILVRRSELSAVVHTHSPHATAVAVMGREIPPVHYSIAAVGGPTVRCAPYALFGTQALSDAAVVALEGRRACLLAHHGVIACGRNLDRALALAAIVEEMARLYVLCHAMGEPPVLTDAQIAEALAKHETYGQQIPEPRRVA